MILKFSKNRYETEILPCDPGTEIQANYKLVLDDNANEYLQAEEYNIQEIINSYADQCSIARIIQAHGLGDDLLLNQKPGVYLDEEAVNTITSSQMNNLEMNARILSLYEGYKDVMSLADFTKAITTGDFESIANAKKPKEEVSE